MKEQTKSDWKHTLPVFGTIKTAGRVYTDSPINGNFHQLRQADYGKGFRQGIFGEQLALVHKAYFNQGDAGADNVVSVAGTLFISGNTAMKYIQDLVIVQDIPKVRNGRIVMDESKLIRKLSKNANKGVRFSDDGSIRAMPYGFGTEWQDSQQMKNNPFPILLTGDLEAGEKLAQIQDRIQKKGYIWALGQGINSVIRVPDLREFDGRLFLDGNIWDEFDDDRGSFGVRQ